MRGSEPIGNAVPLDDLSFVTYLSPGIPRALFETVVEHARQRLGLRRATLRFEERTSGPEKEALDPFSEGEADVGFVCSPSYLWLLEREQPPVELLGVAPVFDDPRTAGEPVYFCDVISRRNGPVRSFADLRGLTWAYNDACSLSGLYSLLHKLAEVGEDEGYFGRIEHAGSHHASIRLVANGTADAASIDANVLRLCMKEFPSLRDRLRVIETWGPFPIQPVVVRASMSAEPKSRLRAAFLAMHEGPTFGDAARLGLRRFAPVTDDHYDAERKALQRCESLLGAGAP